MDTNANYWKQLSRRRFLAGAGVATAGSAALLAGCSSSNKSSNTPSGGGGSTAPAGGTSKPSGGGPKTNVPTPPEIQLAPDLNAIYSGTPVSGGTLQFVSGTPDQYDPARDAGYPGLQIAAPCLSSLVRARFPILGQLSIKGDLATTWEQPDNQTITFHLQPNAKWQNVAPTNGRPLVADDISKYLDYIRTPQPDYVLGPVFEMVDKVETPDDHTVTLHTSFPYSSLLTNLADVWAKIIPTEQMSGDVAKAKPVGSGPFIFDSFTNGVEYKLRKNPDYYVQGKPYLDGVNFHVFDPTNPNLAPAAYRANQIDIGGAATKPLALSLIKDKPDSNWGWRYGVLNPCMLNNSVGVFKDERVRQAMMYAIDYESIIKITWQNYGRLGQQVGLWYTPYLLPDSELPTRDVAKAKQLLSAAGQSNLKTTDKTFQGGQLAFGTLQVQASVKDAGIDMQVVQQQWADWRVNVYGIKGDFDVTMGGEFDFLSVDRQLWNSYHSKGAANNRHVKDSNLDKMLDDSRQEFDTAKYATKIKAITKYITDHAINIALPNGTNPTGTQPWVKGWFFDASAGALLEENFFEDIWIAKH